MENFVVDHTACDNNRSLEHFRGQPQLGLFTIVPVMSRGIAGAESFGRKRPQGSPLTRQILLPDSSRCAQAYAAIDALVALIAAKFA